MMNNEYCFQKIAIGDLEKEKGAIAWSIGGNITSAMLYARGENKVIFGYSQAGQPKEVTIHLFNSDCNYGGFRQRFICPPCRKKVGVLYIGKSFACHTCHNVIYDTQLDARNDKYMRIAQGIRKRLGGTANLTLPFPVRPIGMHHRTYDRLHAAYDKALNYHCILMAVQFGFYDRLYRNQNQTPPPVPQAPTDEELWGADYAPQGYRAGEQVPPDLERI